MELLVSPIFSSLIIFCSCSLLLYLSSFLCFLLCIKWYQSVIMRSIGISVTAKKSQQKSASIWREGQLERQLLELQFVIGSNQDIKTAGIALGLPFQNLSLFYPFFLDLAQLINTQSLAHIFVRKKEYERNSLLYALLK